MRLILVLPLNKIFSDSAREAAVEARRAKVKQQFSPTVPVDIPCTRRKAITTQVLKAPKTLETQRVVEKRIIPAWRHQSSGETILGKRGFTHSKIDLPGLYDMPVNAPAARGRKDPAGWKRGYYDPEEKGFYKAGDIWCDSTDLMTPYQVMMEELKYTGK